MPEIKAAKSMPALPAIDIKPRTLGQRILSLASKAFRSNTEDTGLSDGDLRNKLWDLLYAVEPAFYGLENVYQDSMTVLYITSPDRKLHLWRRTFVIADDGTVTINEDREHIAVTDPIYVYMGENPTTTIAAQTDSDKPKTCGCQTVDAGQSVSVNGTDNDNDSINPKEDTDMPDDPSKPKTDATTTQPAAPAAAPVPTPEKGSSEAATPSQSGSEDKTVPNYPAGEPNPSGDLPGSSTGATNDQLKALLEAHPVVKHYRAQEAKEKTALISALAKHQKVFTQAQLETKSIEDLRTFAELVGIAASPGLVSQPAGDFSGRMMVAREGELPPPPDPHGVNKYLKRGDTTN